MRETLNVLLANNKGADHPAHRCSMIRAYVIPYQKSKVTKSDISYFSIFGGLQNDKVSGYTPD